MVKILIDKIHLDNNFCTGLYNTKQEDVLLWDSQLKSSYDVFDEFQPDIFLGHASHISRGINQCINEYEPATILYNNFWDDLDEEEIKKVIDIKPKLIFNHELKNGLEIWKKYNISTLSILKAADTSVVGQKRNDCFSEISYIGDYYPRVYEYLEKISDRQIRIFGYNAWLIPEYLGSVSQQEMADIYQSSLICPNFSNYKGEISSRVFNILANDGFCVSDPTHIFPANEIPTFSNPTEFKELVEKFLKEPNIRKDFIGKGKERVLAEHTYNHRLDQILEVADV